MIMAAGLGTRLMPLTGVIPKPMVPIAGYPAIGHILHHLRRHDILEVVINLHHLPETIRGFFGDGASLGMSIAYSFEEELMGTAGGVKNNQSFLGGGTCLIMSGDSLTDVDLGAVRAAHRESGGVSTVVTKRVDDPSEYGVVVTDGSRRVLGFQEKPAREDALSDLCNCGIYVFEPEIFDLIPADTFYDFGRQVFPGLLEGGVPFHAYTTGRYWNDVGSLEAYRDGNFDVLAGRVEVVVPGRRVDGDVWVGETSVISPDARIVGPVVIGSGCVIESGAELVGPVVVGDGARVGASCRVTRSVLWEECAVGPGSILEDSLLARGVRLESGAGVRRSALGEGCRVRATADVCDATAEPGTELG